MYTHAMHAIIWYLKSQSDFLRTQSHISPFLSLYFRNLFSVKWTDDQIMHNFTVKDCVRLSGARALNSQFWRASFSFIGEWESAEQVRRASSHEHTNMWKNRNARKKIEQKNEKNEQRRICWKLCEESGNSSGICHPWISNIHFK